MSLNLFYNAKFYSLEQDAVYDWLLTANGRIIELGHRHDIPALSNKTNLHGATVIPAFTDAHTHLAMTALNSAKISLSNTQTLSEVLNLLDDYLRNNRSRGWILGTGYDKNLWPDSLPHRKHLDAVCPDRPVFLESKDCHAVWVNSKALTLAQIKNATPDPPGGRIGRDKDGQPNGLLYERAQELIRSILPKSSAEEIAEAIENFQQHFHSRGVTSVHTMEGVEEFKALQLLNNQGKLKLRTTIYLPQANLEAVIQNGLFSGLGDELLRFGGIKFFLDGSLGSQTAEMTSPYKGTQNYGVAHLSAAELNERLTLAAQNGLSSAVHAIGDKALIKALDAFEKVAARKKYTSLPDRIEHAQLVPDDQFARFKKLALIASVQPVHLADDVHLVEKYWGKRAKNTYPFRQFERHNIPMAFGSDTPVANFDPFMGIYTAVQRRFKFNKDEPSWHPQHCLSLPEAVKAYTIGGALASGEGRLKGTLAPGKVADFIALDRDIFTIHPDDLFQVRIIKTFLNGKAVFES